MPSLKKLLAGLVVTGLTIAGTTLAASANGGSQKWGGLYIGAHVGGAWSDLDWDLNYPFGNAPPSSSFSSDDFIKGGQVGLQHQFGNWVLGAEATFSSALGASRIEGVDLFVPNVGHLQTKIDWMMTVTGRVGYAWDNWLAYVKAGYAGAMIKLEADDNVPPDFGFLRRDMHHGWTVGAGIERMLMKGVIIGLDYSYLNVGDSLTNDVVVLATGTPTGGIANSDIDASIHALTARLSFKLGRDGEKHEPMK